MANNIDLTICAPKPSFRRFRCSAWLIFQKKHTVLFLPKRSCFRFASLTLRTPHRPIVSLCFSGRLIFRLRTESAFQAAPVFRMAYFSEKAHCAFSSKTLMLQVRFALPPNPAPSYRFFVLFSKTHDLQVHFAHPPSAHRNLLSEGSGVPHGLFCDSAPSPIRALVFRSAYSASRNARASAAFAASIKAHCAVSSETLMLQPLRGLRTPHRSPVSSPLAAAAD